MSARIYLASIVHKLPTATRNAIAASGIDSMFTPDIEQLNFLIELRKTRGIGPLGIRSIHKELIKKGAKPLWHPSMKQTEISYEKYVGAITTLQKQIKNGLNRIEIIKKKNENAQCKINKLLELRKKHFGMHGQI